jgi:hypothetical protein
MVLQTPDTVKAFDTVNQEMLRKILKILGVPDSMIAALQKLYKDVTIDLRVVEKIRTQFFCQHVACGVTQGDNLACVLFLSSYTQCPIPSDTTRMGFQNSRLPMVP